MALDLARRHAARVHAQNLSSNPVKRSWALAISCGSKLRRARAEIQNQIGTEATSPEDCSDTKFPSAPFLNCYNR